MKAIVLAAGYATRLAPYARLYPKSLLRVGGRPLLDGTLDALLQAGAAEIVLVTNSRFLPFFVRWRALSPRAGSCPLLLLDDGTTTNEGRRGSVGDLLFALERMGRPDDVLVVCSDKLFRFSLGSFVAFARERGGGANTCVDAGDPAKLAGKHGCLVLDAHDRITEFHEKPEVPPSSIQSIAFYYFPRQFLGLVREYASAAGRGSDAPGTLLEWLAPRAPMYGWFIDGECLDVGDPASYREADHTAWLWRGASERAAAAGAEEVLLAAAQDGLGQIPPLLERLEADPRVRMVHLAVPQGEVSRWESRVIAEPHLVPVDVLAVGGRTPQALAAERNCTRVLRVGSI